jgi:hypothetical protein
VASGGTAGQLLIKTDSTNYNTSWSSVAVGSLVLTNDSRLTDARTPSNDASLVHTSGSETVGGIKTFTSGTLFTSGAQAITVGPGSADHVYIGFNARTATPGTRSAFMGFGSAAITEFRIANEVGGGIVLHAPASYVQFNTTSGVYENTAGAGAVRLYSPSNPPAFTSLTGSISTAQLPSRLGVKGDLSITDWNLARDAGWYTANGATNAPLGNTGWWQVFVTSHDNQAGNLYVTQWAWQFTDGSRTDSNTYERRSVAGTWTAWAKVYRFSGELDGRYSLTSHNHSGVYQPAGSYMDLSSNQTASGHKIFTSADTGTSGWNGPLEIQSVQNPRILLHWPGVIASTLRINSDGAFSFTNDTGASYQSVLAGQITAWGGLYDGSNRAYSAGNIPSIATFTSGTINDGQLPGRLSSNISNNQVTDFNNATSTGFYYTTGAANAPVTNIVNGSDYHIFVCAYSTAWVSQIAVPLHSNRMFVRTYENGAWWSWAEVTTLGRETKAALPATTGTVTMNLSTAAVFQGTPTGTITPAFSNVAPTGASQTITAIYNQGATAYTINLPTGGVWMGGAPTNVANKTTIITYMTTDGGTTWYCSAAVQA